MHSDRGTIERMKSICRNCKHISVNQEDRYYYCSLYNSVITGIITDCNGFERNEKDKGMMRSEIQKIREDKKTLEQVITNMITDFSEKHDVKVTSVDSHWNDGHGLSHKPKLVKIDLRIEI